MANKEQDPTGWYPDLPLSIYSNGGWMSDKQREEVRKDLGVGDLTTKYEGRLRDSIASALRMKRNDTGYNPNWAPYGLTAQNPTNPESVLKFNGYIGETAGIPYLAK